MTKNFLIALAILIPCLAIATGARAQSTSSAAQESTSAAQNLGNNQTIINTAPAYSETHIKSDQAAAVAPSFSSQASFMTCATAGAGMALQLPGGGISGAMGGGVDPGCDLQRDLSIMASIGAKPGERIKRACMKVEIAKAMPELCETKPQPVSKAQPNPWQAGG